MSKSGFASYVFNLLIITLCAVFDGTVVAEIKTAAVSSALIEEIHSWRQAGATSLDVIDRLRLRCVPPGFSPEPWMPGILYTLISDSIMPLSKSYTHKACFHFVQI